MPKTALGTFTSDLIEIIKQKIAGNKFKKQSSYE